MGTCCRPPGLPSGSSQCPRPARSRSARPEGFRSGNLLAQVGLCFLASRGVKPPVVPMLHMFLLSPASPVTSLCTPWSWLSWSESMPSLYECSTVKAAFYNCLVGTPLLFHLRLPDQQQQPRAWVKYTNQAVGCVRCICVSLSCRSFLPSVQKRATQAKTRRHGHRVGLLLSFPCLRVRTGIAQGACNLADCQGSVSLRSCSVVDSCTKASKTMRPFSSRRSPHSNQVVQVASGQGLSSKEHKQAATTTS